MTFDIHWELFKIADLSQATVSQATFGGKHINEIIAESGPEARKKLKEELVKVGAELLMYDTIPSGKDDEGEKPFHAWRYIVKIKYEENTDYYLFQSRGNDINQKNVKKVSDTP